MCDDSRQRTRLVKTNCVRWRETLHMLANRITVSEAPHTVGTSLIVVDVGMPLCKKMFENDNSNHAQTWLCVNGGLVVIYVGFLSSCLRCQCKLLIVKIVVVHLTLFQGIWCAITMPDRALDEWSVNILMLYVAAITSFKISYIFLCTWNWALLHDYLCAFFFQPGQLCI